MCDVEMPRVFREDRVKARKQHRCCECGKTIDPTQTYVRSAGLYEGGWRTFKMCMWCHVLREMHMDKYDTDGTGPAFGNLHEWISYIR